MPKRYANLKDNIATIRRLQFLLQQDQIKDNSFVENDECDVEKEEKASTSGNIIFFLVVKFKNF